MILNRQAMLNLKSPCDGDLWCNVLEACRSPLNPYCGARDIALYIVCDGKRLPICRKCWSQIAETDLEWGEGVSSDQLKKKAEEARKVLLEKVKEKLLREMVKKFARNLVRKGIMLML